MRRFAESSLVTASPALLTWTNTDSDIPRAACNDDRLGSVVVGCDKGAVNSMSRPGQVIGR
jgi:hypothetical protein